MTSEQYEDVRDRLIRIETAFNERVRPGESKACAEHSVSLGSLEKRMTILQGEVTALHRHFAYYAGGIAVTVFVAAMIGSGVTKLLIK